MWCYLKQYKPVFVFCFFLIISSVGLEKHIPENGVMVVVVLLSHIPSGLCLVSME